MLDVADFAPNPAAPELLSLRAAPRADDRAMDDIAMARSQGARQFMNGGGSSRLGMSWTNRDRVGPRPQVRLGVPTATALSIVERSGSHLLSYRPEKVGCRGGAPGRRAQRSPEQVTCGHVRCADGRRACSRFLTRERSAAA